MRMIGYIQSETSARTFSSYLYVQGIKNQIEADKDEAWALWVHGEDELEKARLLLQTFVSRPNDPEYQRAAKQALELKEREEEQERAAAKRMIDGGKVFRDYRFYGMGPVTSVIIAICVVVWIIAIWGMDRPVLASLIDALYISKGGESLPEVRRGQIWRIFTPIFLHDTRNFLHLFFNMLWLKDLGSMIESRQGSRRLALLVLVISASSNLGEYFYAGHWNFGGMSGVVYGLFGYIWMKEKFDPACGLFLHPSTVAMMLIWFVICLTDLTGPIRIANTVHAVGLGVGIAWGYLSSVGPLSRRR